MHTLGCHPPWDTEDYQLISPLLKAGQSIFAEQHCRLQPTVNEIQFSAGNGAEINMEGNYQVDTPDVTSMLALQYGYGLSSNTQSKLVARGEWPDLGN